MVNTFRFCLISLPGCLGESLAMLSPLLKSNAAFPYSLARFFFLHRGLIDLWIVTLVR